MFGRQHAVGEAVVAQETLDDIRPIAGVAGVDIDGNQLKWYRSPPAQLLEQQQQGVGVLAA